MRRGQVIVELALTMPFICFACLGAGEAAFLFADHIDQANRTQALADWSALHPDATEAEFTDIVIEVGPCASAQRSVDDGMVRVAMTCTYSPRITANLWDGLTISTEAVAAIHDGAVDEPEVSP